jgi:6-phosphogluconolactonase (cycloisomerase 2 family)
VTVSPSGEIAYVSNGPSGTISAYRINATGALSPIPGSPFPAGGHPLSLAIAPGGFLLAGNYYSNDIATYTIDSTGGLTPVPGSPFATGPAPIGVVTYVPSADPNRREATLPR